MQAYKDLEARYSELGALRQIDALLNWDRSVFMPEKGVGQRARQAEVLNIKIHQMATDPVIGDWLGKAESLNDLSDWQRANLAIMRRQYLHTTAVPEALVAAKMAQETKTEVIWRKARADSNFSLVQDELAKLLDIVRETAEVKGGALGMPAYDSLMDSYLPHMASSEIDAAFDDVAAFLPGFLSEVLEKQKAPLPLEGPFPVSIQEKIGRDVCADIGFDFSWGRLDVSAHPFSTGIGNDVRITTRYSEDGFMNSLQAVVHEAGHGFYDRYTPEEWQQQPVGISQNMGMGIHESQSLSLDMQLGRSRAYWDYLAPRIAKAFDRSGPAWTGENLYRHAIRAGRGFIRVEADEITYPAHVILRYRLEKRMVEGTLEVKDLPAAWNAEMKKLIGAEPPDDRRGCLQDIHWYFGAYGYFPAYAMGAFIAAQFADKMKQDVPDLEAQVRGGNLKVYGDWLRQNVQSKGCLYTPPELIEKVTGQKFSTHFFKKHLTERYLDKQYEGHAPCSATSAPEAKRRA